MVKSSFLKQLFDCMVLNYIDYNTHMDTTSSGGINVVMLGSGMDALGIWSEKLLRNYFISWRQGNYSVTTNLSTQFLMEVCHQ